MKFSRILLIPSVLAVTLLACSAGEPDDPVSTSASAIQGGIEDKENYFRSTLSVCAGKEPGTSVAACNVRCSSTLIAPNLILTARHCLFEVSGTTCARDLFSLNTLWPLDSIYFGTGNTDAVTSGNWYRPKEIIVPDPKGSCGYDIVLAVLEKSVPITEAVPIEPIVANFPNVPVGQRLIVVGFGQTGPDIADLGTRRYKKGISFRCPPGTYGTDKCASGGVDFLETEFLTDGSGCSADSGSGVFSEDSFQLGTVAKQYGVLVRARSQNKQCVDNVYQRLDSHGKFLQDGAKFAATKGGYAPPAWATAPLDPIIPGGPKYPRGTIGSACDNKAECTASECVSFDNKVSYRCANACTAESDCSDGFTCFSNYCREKEKLPAPIVPEDPPTGCDCGVASRGNSSLGLWAGVVVVGMLARRRRSALGRS